MIRCVRLGTGDDGASHVQIGTLDVAPGRNADLVSTALATKHVTFEETAAGGTLAWHTAPVVGQHFSNVCFGWEADSDVGFVWTGS